MKKLIIFILLLAVGVGEMKASWTATLKGSFDSWGDGIVFTNINENELFVKISGSYLHSETLYFKAYIDGKGERGPGSDTPIDVTGVLTSYTNNTTGAYTISKNENAQDVYIYLKKGDNDDWWAFAALVVENYSSYPVQFSSTWGSVNVYVYHGYFPLYGKWPGTKISDSGNATTTLSALPGSTIIFTNGLGGDENQTGDLELVHNGVYSKTNGLEKISTTISSSGYGTISSVKPLNFATLSSNFTAYLITGATDKATLSTTSVADVPANTGVLLHGTAGNYEIPVIASSSTDVSSNLLKPGTGEKIEQHVGKDTETKYNYILTKDAGGETKDMKFYLVNDAGNTVPVGKAYLQIGYGDAGLAQDPSSSAPPFFNIDFGGETTDVSEKVIVKSEKFLSEESVARNATAPVYNLAGQRVMNPTKGLYIVNGKKVVLE